MKLCSFIGLCSAFKMHNIYDFGLKLHFCLPYVPSAQKMQMVAETIAAALRKGNKGCFTCGNKNHSKKDGPKEKKKRERKYIKIKNLQKSALTAIEKCIGPKIVSLNLTLKENLFQETPSRGPPRSPSTKTRGRFHLFPQTLNIWQCCH